MSRIITNWKCEQCESEFHQRISFGHPDYDFRYKWRCPKCNHINQTLIEAMPRLDKIPDLESCNIFEFKLFNNKLFQAIKTKFKK